MSKIFPKTIKKKSKSASGVIISLSKKDNEFVFAKDNLMLYRLVYSSRVSLCVVFLLLVSFFVQGAPDVYADEIAATPVEDVFVVDTAVSAPAPDVEESVVAINIEETKPLPPKETASVTLATSSPVSTTTAAAVTPSSDSQIDSEKSVVSATTTESSENLDLNTRDSEDDVLLDPLESDVVATDSSIDAEPLVSDSSEEPIGGIEVNHETVSVTESDSIFTFTKDECTRLATGSFYCLQPQENFLKDALFSAPDADGDLEIYLVRAGEQVQVTDNNYDDAAPYFDSNTNTLVWHRLINDRFQIISYDIELGKEEQVTKNSENNMEPTRQGKYTVWQRWVDGGWNIILLEGSTETQLTVGTNNNVAPYVHGNLVVWNKHDLTREKTIEMYDTESNTYVTVDDPDGMSVSNPRMVFVYDSLHPNGDIVTKGYDVLSRKFIELGTLPRELPDELPKADSTGETRALIQSKPSVKSSEVINTGTTTPSAATSSTPVILSATTTAEIMTLDMTLPATTTPEVLPTTTAAETIDIVIKPLVLSTTTEGVQE